MNIRHNHPKITARPAKKRPKRMNILAIQVVGEGQELSIGVCAILLSQTRNGQRMIERLRDWRERSS